MGESESIKIVNPRTNEEVDYPKDLITRGPSPKDSNPIRAAHPTPDLEKSISILDDSDVSGERTRIKSKGPTS